MEPMKLEFGKIFHYYCDFEWNALGIPFCCRSNCTAMSSINCPNTRCHPRYFRHFSTSAVAMFHNTWMRRRRRIYARTEAFFCQRSQASKKAKEKKNLIEFRWPKNLKSNFRPFYLTLQMHRFSAWCTEVVLFAAREHIFNITKLFKAREANNFCHIFATPWTSLPSKSRALLQ